MIRQLCFVLCIITLLAGCKNSSDKHFRITVTYNNAHAPAELDPDPGQVASGRVSHVYLYELPYGDGNNPPITLDSAQLTANKGQFELEGEGREQGMYQLLFDDGHIVLLTNDEKNISLDINFAKLHDFYTVTGSPATTELKEFTLAYPDYSNQVNKAFSEMDSLKKFNASDSLVLAATEVKNNRVRSLNEYLKKYISGTKHPAVAIFALGFAGRSFTKQEFEASLKQMAQKFPGDRFVAELKTNYDARQNQLAEMEKKRSQQSLWVGKTAPELEMPDVNGKPVRLSSFKGKYVLVDFWASWCGPCRLENPAIVTAYNNFKDKNFTILGVSLDREKDDWLKAIRDDNLTWTHISDLQYWSSKAVQLYGFESIPYNILLDPQGKVIAEGLRGEQLQMKLQQLFP